MRWSLRQGSHPRTPGGGFPLQPPGRARPVSPAVRAPRHPARLFPPSTGPGAAPFCRDFGHSKRVHSAGTASAPGPGDASERAETYLRLLAETALRAADTDASMRVWRAAGVLIEAGALPGTRAVEILADLSTAMRARARLEKFTPPIGIHRIPGLMPQRPDHDGKRWRVIPADPRPDPGTGLMALVLTDGQVLAPATLQFPPSAGLPELQVPPWAKLTATDDRGTPYRLTFANGTWAGSTWTGTIMLRPAPPDDARLLMISNENGHVFRARIPAPDEDTMPAAAVSPVPESPGERLLARRAEAMLATLPSGGPAGPGKDRDASQTELAELIETLERAGLLSPLSPVPRQLAGLGQLLGLTATGPVSEVPARWLNVVAYYGRRKKLTRPAWGTAAIGVALPGVDSARFAVAGLRAGPSGSFLHAVGRGLRSMPRHPLAKRAQDMGFSWWVQDDAGTWHLGAVEEASPADADLVLRFALLPPLGHATASLTIEVTGMSHQVTASLPVRW
jgi:hypothetical protein